MSPKTHNKKKSNFVKKVENIVKQTQTKIEEHKFLDVDIGVTMSAGTGLLENMLSIVSVAQGLDYNNRIGNEISVMSVNLKGLVIDFKNSNFARAFIIQDTQTISDTLPNVTDIFSDRNPATYKLNLLNNKRFKILEKSDILFSTNVGVGGPISTQVPMLNMYHKFKYALKVRYNGTTSADYQKNALYFVILSYGTGGGADNGLVVTGGSRLRYIDG